jgi:CzcA family heavy metal efflux pump
MRWIVGSSLKFRYLVVAAAAALVFFGTAELRNQKVDVFPEFAPTIVTIQTACLGLTASEVEELVSVPLEDALNGTPGVDTIRSSSVPQLNNIELRFKRGTDLFKARQLVSERLQTVLPTLPTWAAPPIMMPPVSSTSRIMKIGLTSKTMPLTDLSLTAYWKIRARLLRVDGVANVAIWGERLKDVLVDVDPAKMRTRRVSLDNVMKTTADALDSGILFFSSAHVIGTGGVVETPNQRFPVRHVQAIKSPSDLAQVPLARRNGKTLRLGDVSKVVYGTQPLIGDAVINGGPGLMLVVEKYQGANTLEVTQGVEDALRSLKPGLPGITVDSTIFRPASFIQIAIHNLRLALIIGCALVIMILIAFLYEWRAAFISLIAIPLSLVAAGIVLDLRGAEINTLVLAGLVVSVGVVVDDAIIDMENIVRRLRLRRALGLKTPLLQVVLEASLEVRKAILYATLINVVAVLPVIFMGGLSGAFFRPLALSYALAVLVSMVVALTVTPALSLILMSRGSLRPHDAALVRALKRGYRAVLAPVVRRPSIALSVVGMVALAGVYVGPRLQQSLFPGFKERDFLAHWITTPGTSIKEERRIVTEAQDALRKVPGVRNVGTHIGQAFLGEEIAGVNFGENWISVDPKADYDKTLARIHAVVRGHPGLFRNVQTYMRERIEEVLTQGTGEPVVVRIFGPDLDVLRRTADRLRRDLASVKGLTELHTGLQARVPQIDVQVRLDVARRYGIKPGDVRRAEAALVASEEVADMFRGGRAYNVHVWSAPNVRNNLTAIRKLPIDTPSGGQVPLGRLASVAVRPTPNLVERENDSRKIDVDANVTGGRPLSAIDADVKARLKNFRMPLGYHAELLGEAQERAAAQKSLVTYGIVAALAILLLLQAAFGSWRLAALMFFTLPMALVGGVLAAYEGVGIISLGALIGLFTVMGIAARNGIMMISHFQHLEREEGEAFGPALEMRGAQERLSPILMTALATGLALLPLVISGDKPGQEIEHPMAIVILGGLVTSTLLNLFVVPALYLRVARPTPPAEIAVAAEVPVPLPPEFAVPTRRFEPRVPVGATGNGHENGTGASEPVIAGNGAHGNGVAGNGDHGNGANGNGANGNGADGDGAVEAPAPETTQES